MEQNKRSCYRLTFGSEGHIFRGGWAEVYADSKEKAVAVFKNHHNLNHLPDCAVYCSIYDETEWNKSIYAEKGTNLGKGCHEQIF